MSTPYLLKNNTVNITDKLEDRIFQSEHNNFPHPFVPPYPGYITRKDPLPNISKMKIYMGVYMMLWCLLTNMLTKQHYIVVKSGNM